MGEEEWVLGPEMGKGEISTPEGKSGHREDSSIWCVTPG
jgi:hypothetical protein